MEVSGKYCSFVESTGNFSKKDFILKLLKLLHLLYLKASLIPQVDPVRQESENPVSASLAENFADIYQDLKNFIMLYSIGTNDIMNDALWECKMNFEQYWGQQLVNGLRALHMICYGEDELTCF